MISSTLSESEAQRQTLETQRQQWQAEQQQWERQLDEQNAELIAMRAELDAHRQVLEADRVQLAARLSALEAQSQALEQQWQEWQTNRENAAAAPDQQPAAVEENVEPEPVAAAEPKGKTDAAPVSLADVLRRVGAADLLAETVAEEEAEEPAEVTPLPPPATVEPRSPKASVHHEGEEESIDDYMSRLMERVRGGTGRTESPARRPQNTTPQAAPEAPRAVEVKAAETSTPVPVTPRPPEPVERAPRKAAPEKEVGLSAMRELANLSAKNAISQHARRQMIVSTRDKLLVAVAGLVVGAVMLWFWGRPLAAPLTFYSAIASFIVALFWGMQYAVMTGHLIVDKPGHVAWKWNRTASPAKPAAEEEGAAAKG
jgi:hypothetical protein